MKIARPPPAPPERGAAPGAGYVPRMARLRSRTGSHASSVAAAPPPSGSPPFAPGPPPPLAEGEVRLGLSEGRDAVMYAPPRLRGGGPAPLVVFLHGAGGGAPRVPLLLRDLADAHGLVVLAPESRGATWDLTSGAPGPDLRFLQQAVDRVRSRVAVDERRVALCGFSDGASYALLVGLANGDAFTHVMAFSPGGARGSRPPRPAVFVAHGTRDGVLPVENARAIVERLSGEGCVVSYREFEGGHEVRADVAAEAIRWFLGG